MRSQSNFDDVGDFHEKFDLDNVTHRGVGAREFDEELMRFRHEFMREELDEFETAMHDRDRVKMWDALIDLVYVALGTAHFLGVPWQAGWNEVQRANMLKIRAAADGSDSVRGSGWDVVKPPGWVPPDLESVINRELVECPACRRALDEVNVREVPATMGAMPRVDLHCPCGRYLGSRPV